MRCWGAAARFPPPGTPTYLAGKEVQLGDSGRLLVQACQLHTRCTVSGGAVKETTRVEPPAPLPQQTSGPFEIAQVTVLPANTSSTPCPQEIQGRASLAAPHARTGLGNTIPIRDPPSTSNWDVAGQAGIQQPPPSRMSQVRQRPTHTQSWGGCARGAGSPGTQRGGVRHAPAQPHSPDWSRLLRRRRSAGTAAGLHGALQPGITPSTPRPGRLLPPARCHQCSHIWACWGSLPPSGALWAQGTSPAALPGWTGRSCLAVPGTAEPAELGDSHGVLGRAGNRAWERSREHAEGSRCYMDGGCHPSLLIPHPK